MGTAAWRKIVLGVVSASLVGAALPQTANAAENGMAEYEARCAPCHGENGAGDGPAASALRDRPSDLRLLAKNNDGVFPDKVLESVIDGRKTIRAHGNFEMPVWGRALSQPATNGDAAARISAVVEYLRTIQVK
ncbi:MAG TPA: cytochrome c [Rhizomicrobium sp.]|nr:cytochrome c [Rhizomicrobium sp.]